MNLFEIGLLVAVGLALYCFQQIKIILKNKGYEVEVLTGWGSDLQKFKHLIAKEKDDRIKRRYTGILYGLYLAGAILILAVYGLLNQ